MATIKELYDLCKKKQEAGEKLGFLLQAFVEEYEKEGFPGELRGVDIYQAEEELLQKGDVVVLPAGTPHKLDTEESGISYIVIKIQKQ